MKALLHTAIAAALKGAKEVMAVYNYPSFDVELKSDNSPVTIADKRSNDVIEHHLLTTGIPVLSEESAEIPFVQRVRWNRYWLVDPLDGTRQFIKRNDQFTINIALSDEKGPSLGVILLPVSSTLFFGIRGEGAYKATAADGMDVESIIASAVRLHERDTVPPIVAINTSSTNSLRMQAFLAKVKQDHDTDPELYIAGSALKFGVLAEGKAGYYPRFKPSMEWDTAAGHAIVKEVGYSVFDADSGEELKYNKPSMLNPSFIVCRPGYI